LEIGAILDGVEAGQVAGAGREGRALGPARRGGRRQRVAVTGAGYGEADGGVNRRALGLTDGGIAGIGGGIARPPAPRIPLLAETV
jgi:hypothetical protein